MKKILSMILAVCLVMSFMTVAFAEETVCSHDWKYTEIPTYGTHTKSCDKCGANETENCVGCEFTNGCELCGSKLLGIHPDTNKDAHCDGCEYPLDHEDEFLHDEEKHWIVCSLDETKIFMEDEHEWGEWTETKPATEDAEGEKVRVCELCEREEKAPIDKLPHTHVYTHDSKVVEPTCTEKGYTENFCKCGESEKVNYVDVKEHRFNSVTVAPTCTEKGYTKHTCDCGYSYNDTEVAAKGHNFGEWKVTKEATYKDEGEKSRTCSVCKFVETEKIDKISHECKASDKLRGEKKASCVEDGYTGDVVCLFCEKVMKAGSKVSPTGHDTKNAKLVGKKDATCSKVGYTGDKVCPLCEEILEKGKDIKKLDHTWDEKGFCKVCKADKSNPKTGDDIMISVYAMGASLMGLVACAFVFKKKSA